jgi:hypothetical protein
MVAEVTHLMLFRAFLSSVSDQLRTPAAPFTHPVGSCMGPRTELDVVQKKNLFPMPGIESLYLSHHVSELNELFQSSL